MQEKNTKDFVDPEMVERLKKAISEKYKSKSEFAEKIGATYEIVRLWCKGKSKPSTDFMISIAINTTISIDWLLTGKEKSESGCDVGCTEDEKELGRQAVKVLKSKTAADYSGSLRDNIKSFYLAVIAEEEKNNNVKQLQNDMNDLRQEINDLKNIIIAASTKEPNEPTGTG